LFRSGTDARMAWRRWVRSPMLSMPGALAWSSPAPGPADRGLDQLLDAGDQSLSRLLGLSVRTIVLDPGHGGRDPGAVGPDGLLEKEVNLAVALALRERLSRLPELYVLLTRNRDSSLSLRERVAFANLHGADLFISIHVNALGQTFRPFVETFYLGGGEALVPREQLQLENRYSGYTVGEFRQLLERLDHRFRDQESHRLAMALQTALFFNLRLHNQELLNGGLKTAPLVVLLGAEMPAVLVEVSSLSNRAEEARLRTPHYRALIAEYLAQGILDYLDDGHPRQQKTDHHARSPQYQPRG